MSYFPFFTELSGKEGLIVGGGTVALRKLQKLLPYGPHLTAAAPDICPEIENLSKVTLLRQTFSEELLEGKDFVIAAADDAGLNHRISSLCQERRIPVNAVDDRAYCSFLFPALVKRGELSIGISTGGASPSAAVYLKDKISDLIPEDFDGLLDYLNNLREIVKQAIPDQKKRSACLSRLFSACMEDGWPLDDQKLQRLLDRKNTASCGCVWLVGAGCGAADLITVRGMSLLRSCDTVIYDELIDRELLSCVPEKAEIICMGKRGGRPSSSQQEICDTMIAKAREGKRVVRLKGGDPFVFGRGGEEIMALQAAGIPYEEVPGISSAIAIPAAAGIPVTHRGISQSVHIITAHTADTEDGLPACFDTLAQLPGTLVFLMGLRQLPLLVQRLLAAGKDPATPAAVLSGGNSPHHAAVRAPLADLAKQTEAAQVRPPAVIVVGDVAGLDLSSTL